MFGFGLAIAYSILMTITFFHAYLNGFTTRINIDVFGEAHFEAVLVPVTMLVILVSFFYYVKGMKVDEVVKE